MRIFRLLYLLLLLFSFPCLLAGTGLGRKLAFKEPVIRVRRECTSVCSGTVGSQSRRHVKRAYRTMLCAGTLTRFAVPIVRGNRVSEIAGLRTPLHRDRNVTYTALRRGVNGREREGTFLRGRGWESDGTGCCLYQAASSALDLDWTTKEPSSVQADRKFERCVWI